MRAAPFSKLTGHAVLVTAMALAITPALPIAEAHATGLTSFSAGDLVVYRVGDGTPANFTTNKGAAVFLDEYTPAGSLVGSVALPTADNGANKALVAEAGSASEGLLTLGGAGGNSTLVATGYDTTVGGSGNGGSGTLDKSTNVNRDVALVSASGVVDTTTAVSNFASANNPRSAVYDGSHIWVAGAAGGILEMADGTSTTAATTAITDSSTWKNFRMLSIYNGQLYASADPTKNTANTFTLGTIGSNLPTTGTVTPAQLSGVPTVSTFEPYQYAFATLGTGSAPDTLYVAENASNAIDKFSLSGGNWTAKGSISLPTGAKVTGLTASNANGTVYLFASTPSGMYAATDASAQTSSLSGSISSALVSAGGSTSFQGLAFAPGTTTLAAPAITSGNSTTFTTGSSGTFNVTTTGQPAPALSVTSGTLPTGVTLVDNGDGTATLSGAPGAATAGTYPFTIGASSGIGSNASQGFTLTVAAPSSAPAITSANSKAFTLGQSGTFSVTTTGTAPVALSDGSATLPSGVTFHDNGDGTATLSGTPGTGTVGSYPFTITASNGTAPNATQSFTLTVAASPFVVTEFAYGGKDGSGPDGEYAELTNTGSAAQDVSGWFFDTSSSTAISTATPLPTAGTSLSTLADGSGSNTLVQPGESVIITDLTPAQFRTEWGLKSSVKVVNDGTATLKSSGSLYVSNGTTVLDRIAYNLSPPGKGFSAWVSSANVADQQGPSGSTFSSLPSNGWTVSMAADSQGSWTSASGSVGSPAASTLGTSTPTSVRTTALSVSGGSNQNATVNTAFSFTGLSAAGGTAPYTWGATGLTGTGLSINSSTGAITGTPTSVGVISVTATATDSASATANASFTITVGSGIDPNWANIVINEVTSDNSDNTQLTSNLPPALLAALNTAPNVASDLVELYNKGTQAVDITGWKQADSHGAASATVFSSRVFDVNGNKITSIPGHGYGVFQSGQGLGSGGDAAQIYLPDGTLVDSVTYGAGQAGYDESDGATTAAEVYHALARCPADGAGAVNTNSNDATTSWYSVKVASFDSSNSSSCDDSSDPNNAVQYFNEQPPTGLPGSCTPSQPSGSNSVSVPDAVAWPTNDGVTNADNQCEFVTAQDPTGNDMSGLVFSADGNVLWGAQNKNHVWKLVKDPATGKFVPATDNSWSNGKAITFTGTDPNASQPDDEGLTVGGNGDLFVTSERDNANSNVSKDEVLEYDPTALGTTLAPVKQWDLTSEFVPSIIAATGDDANLGFEGVTYVPDSFLTSHGFHDQHLNKTYDPADYPLHGSGLFFLALEKNGHVYAYALNSDGTYQRVADIDTGIDGTSAIADVQFNADDQGIWTDCDNDCGVVDSLLRINASGNFTRVVSYNRPAGLPNDNLEGFAIAPASTATNGKREVVWADDGIYGEGNGWNADHSSDAPSVDWGHGLYTGTIPTPASGGSISGTVTSGGSPVSGVCAYVYTSGGVRTSDPGACSAADGTYSVAVAADGSYKVGFLDPSGAHFTWWTGGAATLASATPVSVTGGGTVTVNPALTGVPGGVISGTATAASGGAPVSGICAYVYTAAGVRTSDPGVCTDASGHYSMPVAANGSYDVGFLDPSAVFQTWWTGGAATLASATPVSVTGGGTATVNPTLSAEAGGTISGTVTATGGAALSGVCAYVYTAAGVRTSDPGVCTDASGHYSMPVATNGSDDVGFLDPSGAHVTTWSGNAASQASATPVTVTGGGTATVNVIMPVAAGGTISGTVTAASGGAPVSGICAYVYTAAGVRTSDPGVCTDASGHYSMPVATNGSYDVGFLDPSAVFQTWWTGGAATLASATPVSVTGGGTVTVNPTLSAA